MTYMRRPGIVLSPTDGIDTLHEKELAIQQFEPYMETLAVNTPLSNVVQKATEIDNAVSPDYPYSGVRDFILHYYGVELLPFVMPDIQRQHYAVDRSTSNNPHIMAIDLQENWYESVHGISVIDLCRTIGIVILHEGRQTNDRIERVKGACGAISNKCFDTLPLVYPENTSLAKSQIYTHLNKITRRRVVPGDDLDYLQTLGSSHSLFGIKVDDRERPAILCIDPTIAQVDQTQDYDIEVTRVPQEDYDTFLRLRYRAY